MDQPLEPPIVGPKGPPERSEVPALEVRFFHPAPCSFDQCKSTSSSAGRRVQHPSGICCFLWALPGWRSTLVDQQLKIIPVLPLSLLLPPPQRAEQTSLWKLLVPLCLEVFMSPQANGTQQRSSASAEASPGLGSGAEEHHPAQSGGAASQHYSRSRDVSPRLRC